MGYPNDTWSCNFIKTINYSRSVDNTWGPTCGACLASSTRGMKMGPTGIFCTDKPEDGGINYLIYYVNYKDEACTQLDEGFEGPVIQPALLGPSCSGKCSPSRPE